MAAPLAVAVFALTFLMLAARRVGRIPLQRGPTALVGGLLMVLVGALAPSQVLDAIDLGTLALLLGMMLLAGALAVAGFFTLAAAWIARHARHERALVVWTLLGSAVLSALFLNDTVALFLPPVLIVVLRAAHAPTFRTLAAAAIGVNVGSLWTPIGNPQNAYLATAHDIPFTDFAVHMTPLVLLGLVVAALVLAPGASRIPFPLAPAVPRVEHKAAMSVALLGVGATLCLFLAARPLGLPLWLIAIGMGALVLAVVPLLTPRRDAGAVLARVDGNLLLLFGGLFLLVRGAEESGITDAIFGAITLAAATTGAEVARITLATFVGSNLFSNVPAVLLLDAAVSALGEPVYAQLLAAASTLSGNTTLLASAATLIIAEQAEAHGERFPFWRFTRYGLLVTLVTMGATVPYFAWLTAST